MLPFAQRGWDMNSLRLRFPIGVFQIDVQRHLGIRACTCHLSEREASRVIRLLAERLLNCSKLVVRVRAGASGR